jgi:hypothetical protein
MLCIYVCCSGALSFHASAQSVHWVTGDLLRVLDAPIYFPPQFDAAPAPAPAAGSGSGSASAAAAATAAAAAVKDVAEYPGLLLPSFLSRLLAACAGPASPLLAPLVQGVVSAVCGTGTGGSGGGGGSGGSRQLESMTTCKWVLSAFALPAAQSSLLRAPPCLRAAHLLALRSFLQVCCAVLCCAVLYCAVLCCVGCIVVCCAVLCCVMLCCGMLCYAVLCCVVVCYAML